MLNLCYFLIFQFLFSVSSTNQAEFDTNMDSGVNFFNYANHIVPHPDKIYKGGEDAVLSGEKILVVADGVGGWNDVGVDPGRYSNELCDLIGDLFIINEDHYIYHPKALIEDSHKMNEVNGSTTVCMMTLEDDQLILRTAFVGDSGYAIYRRQNGQFQLIFKSKEQQKSFNYPYQIGSWGDDPSCAITNQHDVKHLDLVVMGTDGLFDNLSAERIKFMLDVDQPNELQVNVSRLARYIANTAYRLSKDKVYLSPFAKSAIAGGYQWQGGKIDDITVIVAQIFQAPR